MARQVHTQTIDLNGTVRGFRSMDAIIWALNWSSQGC